MKFIFHATINKFLTVAMLHHIFLWESMGEISDLNARDSCAFPEDWPVTCVVYLFILFIHKSFLSTQVSGTWGAGMQWWAKRTKPFWGWVGGDRQ